MFEVKVTLRAPTDGDVVRGAAIVQKQDGQRWRNVEIIQLRSDTPMSSERTLLLEADERIVVEGESIARPTKYDPRQMAVVAAKTEPSVGEFRPSADTMEASVGPLAGPLPPGDECQVGVWRDFGGEADWARTGAKYRIY